jgi:pilus assembly protein Flp/PilA
VKGKNMNIHKVLAGVLADQRGLTTVEYAIAGGLVGAAIITGFVLLGGDVGAIIAYIDQQLCSNNPGC